MDAALWASQLATFVAGAFVGGVLVYWTMRATASRRHHQGDTMTAQNRDRSKLAVAVIGMAAILIVFGLQVRDKNERDDDYRRQQAAFRAQQTCLTKASLAIGQYLATTLNRRVQANGKVAAAQKDVTAAGAALSAANTKVVLVVAGAFDVPPTASRQDLVDALIQFRDLANELTKATKHLAVVEKAAKPDLDTGTDAKPYDPPRVDCTP